MNLQKGNRYLLVKISDTRTKFKALLRPEEHFILEISESGNAFKTRLIDSSIRWEFTENWKIVEELPKENKP